jgi:hypothetical protein
MRLADMRYFRGMRVCQCSVEWPVKTSGRHADCASIPALFVRYQVTASPPNPNAQEHHELQEWSVLDAPTPNWPHNTTRMMARMMTRIAPLPFCLIVHYSYGPCCPVRSIVYAHQFPRRRYISSPIPLQADANKDPRLPLGDIPPPVAWLR